MSILQNLVMVGALGLFAVGVHNLQFRLERWDHERHFNN